MEDIKFNIDWYEWDKDHSLCEDWFCGNYSEGKGNPRGKFIEGKRVENADGNCTKEVR